jgi:hypothetical protein
MWVAGFSTSVGQKNYIGLKVSNGSFLVSIDFSFGMNISTGRTNFTTFFSATFTIAGKCSNKYISAAVDVTCQ